MIFTNVVKPTHACNLACKYCYNEDAREPVMLESTLRRVIEQTFTYVKEYAPERLVSFIWHGGEPMIAGLSFFERAAEIQEEYAMDLKYNNSIQTNGTLLDQQWLEFFKSMGFTVSISIDGPRDLHDSCRIDRHGRGSFDKVEKAISMVQEAAIPLGVCVVISRVNVGHVEEIYDFLAARKLRFNVIPLNKAGGAQKLFDNIGIDPKKYADAWTRMYDRWFDADEGYVYCSDFVFKTRAIIAGRPADCIGLEQCSNTNISVDPEGNVYPCATLSGDKSTRYGNLLEADMSAILNTRSALDYRHRQTDEKCRVCRWQHVCHGGCQARSYKFFNDHNRRDYYCPGLFRIYEHISNRVSDKLGFTHILSNEKGD